MTNTKSCIYGEINFCNTGKSASTTLQNGQLMALKVHYIVNLFPVVVKDVIEVEEKSWSGWTWRKMKVEDDEANKKKDDDKCVWDD